MDLALPELSSVKKIITCTVEGIVDEDDLRILASGKAPAFANSPRQQEAAIEEAEDPADIKKVREKHHSVARFVAGGMQQSLVASLTGYTDSYLSILLNSPAMQELVEMYRLQQGAAVNVITEKLRTVGMKAIEKLESKIDADGLNATELTAAAKLGLDRAGHGPTSTQKNVNETHILDHAKLKQLNDNARRASLENIVPVSDIRKVLEHKPLNTDTTEDPDLG